jgi:hypothetical protein
VKALHKTGLRKQSFNVSLSIPVILDALDGELELLGVAKAGQTTTKGLATVEVGFLELHLLWWHNIASVIVWSEFSLANAASLWQHWG